MSVCDRRWAYFDEDSTPTYYPSHAGPHKTTYDYRTDARLLTISDDRVGSDARRYSEPSL